MALWALLCPIVWVFGLLGHGVPFGLFCPLVLGPLVRPRSMALGLLPAGAGTVFEGFHKTLLHGARGTVS